MTVNREHTTPLTTERLAPIEKLITYRKTFGEHLAGLRERCGYSLEEAARRLSLPANTLQFYENSTWQPTLQRLLRITALYEVELLEFLKDVARVVQPTEDPSRIYEVDALLLFNGVLPEQLSPDFDRDGINVEVDPIDKSSLAETSFYRRESDPERIKAAQQLRGDYEKGASIRDLAKKYKLPYGTVRAMLVTAGTALRKCGGSKPRKT
ncbi:MULTISPECIES: helix-turn-helix domain-containing protein [Actinosynnema]|uniref:helix-turn-helix domain-containing protein n=1 Tax=Actinosynnema TaxID=40566 RepID=UPI0020A394AF|nr:helix-turn-helix domain-containing protein [Actinosynnema pretiosum]MCP2097415.1 Helix-turn-helix domain-containing protein [Actinosynnema pretiosum]